MVWRLSVEDNAARLGGLGISRMSEFGGNNVYSGCSVKAAFDLSPNILRISGAWPRNLCSWQFKNYFH